MYAKRVLCAWAGAPRGDRAVPNVAGAPRKIDASLLDTGRRIE
jgi:hypothetical protein